MEEALHFPPDFIWGTAASAYQIEGAWNEDGRGPSIWDTFAHRPGKVWHGQTGDVAADHYHRWAEDVDLMAGLGLQAYRFSVSWPRVLPKGAGAVNQKGLDFYDRLVDALLARGIQPFVALCTTLTCPRPCRTAAAGPPATPPTVSPSMPPSLPAAWATAPGTGSPTMSRPPMAFNGYALGTSAPGLRNPVAALQAMHHLLLSHGLAAQAIRAAASGPVQIGTAINTSPVYPATPADRGAAVRMDALVNRLTLDPLLLGRYPQDTWAADPTSGPCQGGRHGHHRHSPGLPWHQLLHADHGAPRVAPAASLGVEGTLPAATRVGHVGDLPSRYLRPADPGVEGLRPPAHLRHGERRPRP